jgi:UDP-N-acetylmuramyl pentapeptide phosphotransferase/UDP-N-acetylglucosamine-1-phosphate transferase
MNWIKEIQHDISGIRSTVLDLKKFGLTVGGVFLFLGICGMLLLWWREAVSFVLIGLGVLLIVGGFLFAEHLRTIHRYWMGGAIVLGAIVSRVILFIVFYSVLLLISVIAKISGKQFSPRYKSKDESYWIFRNKKESVNYERMS